MMHYAVILLIHVISLTVAISANIQSTLPSQSPVVEVTCIVFTSFYECSDKINKTDDVYKRYSDVCRNSSLGAKFLHNTCTRNTMNEFFQYFEKQTVPANGNHRKFRWRHLKKNPKKIVNFVMSTMLNNEIYKRPIRKIHEAIQDVKIELRSGYISSNNTPKISDDLLLEFSCSVFSVARYCSHQLDHCHKKCLLLERVCTRLSFCSRLLSLSCNKETVSAITSLLHPSDDVFSNEEASLWKEMFMESPRTYVDKLMKILNTTFYRCDNEGLVSATENNGTKLKYSDKHVVLLFISLFLYMYSLI